MIKISVAKKNGVYRSFKCSGHAGFAEYGNDVVCAAVSMLVINTVNAIDELTGCCISLDENDSKNGKLAISFPDGTDEKAGLLMDAMLLGIKQVAEDHDEYVSLNIED